MLKRILLFLVTNIAILAVFSITFSILSSVFWIQYASVFNGSNYGNLLVYAAVVWFLGSIVSLFLSKMMAKWSYSIQIIEANQVSGLSGKERLVYDVVQKIAQDAHIKMPEVGIYESMEPNAFATWATKNSSLVAVSTGLLHAMSEEEIEGVIAHEMAHILNGDMVTMVLVQWIINTFVIFISRILASFIEKMILSNQSYEESSQESTGGTWIYFVVSMVLEIIFWILASLIVMWFSRYREYRADEGSAKLVGKEKMIAALKRLQLLQDNLITDDSDKLATLKIWSKSRGGLFSYFSSHPDLEDRIMNLQNKSF